MMSFFQIIEPTHLIYHICEKSVTTISTEIGSLYGTGMIAKERFLFKPPQQPHSIIVSDTRICMKEQHFSQVDSMCVHFRQNYVERPIDCGTLIKNSGMSKLIEEELLLS